MKSKTSCFNRTIFKKNFTHFWPLWLLYQIYLLVVIPVRVWQKAASPYYYYGTGNEDTTCLLYTSQCGFSNIRTPYNRYYGFTHLSDLSFL